MALFCSRKITDVKEETLPGEFALQQNYPNPFNPSTTIRYSIPGNVVETLHATSLRVFDILGNVVATLVNENKAAGNYEVKFNASNLSSGIYFYKLQSGSFAQTKKFILIKQKNKTDYQERKTKAAKKNLAAFCNRYYYGK